MPWILCSSQRLHSEATDSEQTCPGSFALHKEGTVNIQTVNKHALDHLLVTARIPPREIAPLPAVTHRAVTDLALTDLAPARLGS